MTTMQVRSRWSFHVNHNRTWRHRLGWALRSLAGRLDGRASLALNIQTAPRLPAETVAACINRGLADMQRYLASEVDAEACEQLLRFSKPELYREKA